MQNPIRKIIWRAADGEKTDSLISREWLVTNGLGGYASGTLSGIPSRRYHGLLISAEPAPLGRINMLSYLSEHIWLPDGREIKLCGIEREGEKLEISAANFLQEFRLEAGLPVWRYRLDSFLIEKRIVLPHMQNSTYISYHLLEGDGPVRMEVYPALQFRSHEAPVSEKFAGEYVFQAVGERYEISGPSDLPALRMHIHGAEAIFTVHGQQMRRIFYRVEARRGYESTGDLWNPGFFQFEIEPESCAALVVSTEAWHTIEALTSDVANKVEHERRQRLLGLAEKYVDDDLGAELVLGADKFIIMPATRARDEARAHAAGEESRTVIAGYHWFTDWGRDTMISFEGLTLVTGRHAEASHILRTFASYVRNGLIPNLFPECENDGLYHTADATLWFFHAVGRYIQYTGDYNCLHDLLPVFKEIIECHLRGTLFGIGIDPEDGLFRQGQEGFQLTWMDAKVDGWVVTPRRGKAVELNALWYNALCLMSEWLDHFGETSSAKAMRKQAEQCRHSFNNRFVAPGQRHLFDVVDGENGNDDACRPNQIFAISLPHPILEFEHWKPVLEVVSEELLTPVGLRTLSRDHPNFKPTYHGDLRTRDAAYHQGTVWPWILGAYYDAWLKTYPKNRMEARKGLDGLIAHLNEACVGSVSEIFNAEPPFHPRGCIAQAWSIAEFLRIWAKLDDKLPA